MNYAFAFDFSDDFDRAMYTGSGTLTLTGEAIHIVSLPFTYTYVGQGGLTLSGIAQHRVDTGTSDSMPPINSSHLLSGNMLFVVSGTWILKNRLSVAGSCMFNNTYLKGYTRGARYQ